MKYVFVDTDNGTASPGTPVQTTATWPANSDRFSTLNGALSNATVQSQTDDVTVFCIGAAADTAVVTVTSSLLAASLTIEGNVSDAIWDTAKYRLTTTGASANLLYVSSYTSPVTFSKLQISNTGSNTTPYSLRLNPGSGTSTYIVDKCIVRIGGSGTGTGYGIRSNDATARTVKITNTIVQQVGTPGGRRDGILFNSVNIGSVYNSVVEGFSGTSAVGINNATTIKNTASFDNTDDFLGGTISYCASDDGDGTNAQTSVTWANEFIDYVNGNFRLKSGGIKLQGTGIGPSSDANVPSTDIAGVTRSGTTTDIGASMFVSTGLTITSVNTTNTAFSAQTDSSLVGTGLSASVVCTYAGIACTNESASSSTSLKITFPNFFTNNIKLGRDYEFKVVG